MDRSKSLQITLLTYLFTIIIGGVLGHILFNSGMDIISVLIIIDVCMTALVFIMSLLINNSSMYDPYWSVIPPFLVLLTMVWLNQMNIFAMLILFGVLVWAYRLTRNWYIDFKGFSHEDFRYVDFRNQFKGFYWVVSFLGIHLFPTLIVLISLYPILVVFENPMVYNHFIFIGVLIMMVGALISFYADKQRREHKLKGLKTSITSGLWKYSRHPNYFGELCFWFGVYVTSFSVGVYIESSIGFVGMLLLFNFYSVPRMEKKLLGNKPDYQFVINNIPRFFIRPNKLDDIEYSEYMNQKVKS